MKRMDSFSRGVAAIALSSLVLTWTSAAAERFPATSTGSTGHGMAAMENAARGGKYLFVYFWKQNDQQTQSMYGVFQTATQAMPEAAHAISVNIGDLKEQPLVDRFDVSRAPMPLVLAIAPNGAVTKGIPISFTEQQLREAFVSRGTAQCLKALQNRKLVLLCVHSQASRVAPASFQGVREFVADARFANSTEIVAVDATDQSEAGFLQSLQVDPRRTDAVAVLLAPPGQPVAKFTSAVTKDQIVARVSASSSECCPGGKCEPGQQCGPGQQCAPGQKCGPNGCRTQ